jgi:hypothetical protein
MADIESIIKSLESLDIPASNVPYAIREDSKQDSEQRATTKNAFIDSPRTAWPEIKYPNLRFTDLENQLRQLLDLMRQLNQTDATDEEKTYIFEALEAKLQETQRQLVIVQMIGAKAINPDASVERIRDNAGVRSFERFGEMNEDRFNYYVAKDRDKAKKVMESPDSTPLERLVAQEFLDGTNSAGAPPENFTHYELEKGTLDLFKSDLVTIYPNLATILSRDIPEKVNRDDSLPYFDETLDAFGLYQDGYCSRLTEKQTTEENPISKTIDVGGKGSAFRGERINPLSIHEAVHLLRSRNALAQESPTKRMPSYTNTAFEEGLCTVFEQIVTGKERTAGQQYYESIGFQLGLDRNGQRRNFRETLELLWRRYAIIDGIKKVDDIHAAKAKAYKTVLRTSRGNAVDARDKSYNDGDQSVKKWLLEIKDLPDQQRREKIEWVLSGQFDPTDQDAARLFSTAEE